MEREGKRTAHRNNHSPCSGGRGGAGGKRRKVRESKSQEGSGQ